MEWLVELLTNKFKDYERYVVGSGLSKSLRTYVKLVIRFSIIALAACMTLYVVGVLVYGFKLIYPAIDMAIIVLIFVTMFFTALILLPKLLYINRGFKLEAKYYRLLFFTSLLLTSGAGVIKAILGLREFKEELEDFKIELEIMDDRLSLGYDLAEVIDYVASITPCKSLSNLLLDMLSLERSGRNVMPVITNLVSSYFTSLKSRMEEITNYLSMLSEIFIATAIIFPMIVMIISSTTTAIPIGGFDPSTLLAITLLIIIPVASILYYIAVDYVLSGVAI